MESKLKEYRRIFEIPEDINIHLENIEKKQELVYIPEEKKLSYNLTLDFHRI